MNTVVITGSTSGIGFGMAESFLKSGCAVIVNGRTEKRVQEAVAVLGSKYQPERILGVPCDVADPAQLQHLWDSAIKQFNQVDIWINNAGTSGPGGNVWEIPTEEIQGVISANILGTIYGSNVAIKGMQDQGFGALYNMEGYGSDGTVRPGMASVYGTTKAGIHFFTKSLAKDLKESKLIIGSLRPGMVITDFVMQHFEDDPERLERVRGIFNIIADTVENVSPWLTRKILGNQKSGVVINYSSPWRYLGRIMMRPFKKRNVFADYS
ncbi:MAG: SDR family oxidoreductase [Anaerolineales bacterium]|nr:SDR family oxidoreductase [Chloroflexota bacterium]MBL6980880.1 SDR family oxidoreductase [Anaerolineales bacterium]